MAEQGEQPSAEQVVQKPSLYQADRTSDKEALKIQEGLRGTTARTTAQKGLLSTPSLKEKAAAARYQRRQR